MRILRHVMWILCAGAMTAHTGLASAQPVSTGSVQAYPNKSIRIVTSEIGAGNDILARIVAQEISPPLGQPVIVEHRGATMASVSVSKALPNGYTLLLAANALWLAPFLQDMPYDAVKDFAPISTVSNQPVVLVIHPSVPATTIKEFIALAKAKPGALSYGSSATGTVSHLAGELLKVMGDVNILRVPFKGTGPAMIALFGGQVQMSFPTPSAVPQLVKAGKLKALAVSSLQPSSFLPDLPTISASGLPGYEIVSRVGILAPAKTPVAIINRLNQEIVRALASTEVKEKILALGSEIGSNTPDAFRKMIADDMTRMGKVIKDAGLRGAD